MEDKPPNFTQENVEPKFSEELTNQNWKVRKESLEKILMNPNNTELFMIFWPLCKNLLKDSNIPCLSLTLQVIQQNISKIPAQYLNSIVETLINSNVQNQKTTIHKMSEDIIMKISASPESAKIVLDELHASLQSKNQKAVKILL